MRAGQEAQREVDENRKLTVRATNECLWDFQGSSAVPFIRSFACLFVCLFGWVKVKVKERKAGLQWTDQFFSCDDLSLSFCLFVGSVNRSRSQASPANKLGQPVQPVQPVCRSVGRSAQVNENKPHHPHPSPLTHTIETFPVQEREREKDKIGAGLRVFNE